MSGADRTERIHPVRSADLSCGSTDSRPGRGIRQGSDSYEMRGGAHTPLRHHLQGIRFRRRGNGQCALLEAVRASVRKKHSTMNMGAYYEVVAVPFGHAVRFEGRPAFAAADGSFTCPDTNRGGSRKKTDPNSEIQGTSEPE